jgi:hypothetical protein
LDSWLPMETKTTTAGRRCFVSSIRPDPWFLNKDLVKMFDHKLPQWMDNAHSFLFPIGTIVWN